MIAKRNYPCLDARRIAWKSRSVMMATVPAPDWIDRFDGLSRLVPEVKSMLTSRSRVVTVKAGATVFGPGKMPDHLLLLLEGTLRVQQVAENGREVVLYRVRAGESCVLTTACLLAYEDYLAEGIAETEVQAVAIPRAVFDDLMASSTDFRSFVFSAYSRRIAELFQVIEDIAFRRLDIRVAQKLLDRAEGDSVKVTHAQLAAELGSAREVISRQLVEFQRRGWIGQSRGVVHLSDAAALADLARS